MDIYSTLKSTFIMSTYFRNDLLPYPCLYLAIFSPNILGEHLLLKQPFSLASVTMSFFIGTLITYPKCQAPWIEFLGFSTCTTISSLTWGFAHLFSSLTAIINMVIFDFPVTSLMQNGERSGENRHQQREVAESTRFLSLYSLFPSFLSWAS